MNCSYFQTGQVCSFVNRNYSDSLSLPFLSFFLKRQDKVPKVPPKEDHYRISLVNKLFIGRKLTACGPRVQDCDFFSLFLRGSHHVVFNKCCNFFMPLFFISSYPTELRFSPTFKVAICINWIRKKSTKCPVNVYSWATITWKQSTVMKKTVGHRNIFPPATPHILTTISAARFLWLQKYQKNSGCTRVPLHKVDIFGGKTHE